MPEHETESSRLIRAARCEPSVFAEVAADGGATRGALYVVFGVAVAAGIGHLPGGGLSALLVGSARWLVAWALWLLTVHLGALALGHPSELGRLFRSLSYASVPFALAALEWIPLLGALVWLAKWVVGFLAFMTGARAALDLEHSSAALLSAVGLIPAALALRLL